MPRAAVPIRILPEMSHLSACRCARRDCSKCSSSWLPVAVNVGEFKDSSYGSAGPIFAHRLTIVNQCCASQDCAACWPRSRRASRSAYGQSCVVVSSA